MKRFNTEADLSNKARAEWYLAETLKILEQLEAERKKMAGHRRPSPNIIAEVKTILGHG